MKLKAPNFQVATMNTYDTNPVESVPLRDLEEAMAAYMVNFWIAICDQHMEASFREN